MKAIFYHTSKGSIMKVIIHRASIVILMAALFGSVLWIVFHPQEIKLEHPEIVPHYPSQYKPLNFIKYSKRGLWDDMDIPRDFYKNPYSIEGRTPRNPSWEIVAVGDIMAHEDIQLAAFLHRRDPGETSGGYDWLFRRVRHLFLKADLAVGNLETAIAPSIPRSGYPRFNADPLYLDALKKAGFDLLFTANNHSLDYGKQGLIETLNELDKRHILNLGTTRPGEARRVVLHREIGTGEKLDVAFLNYTFTSNRQPTGDTPLNMLPEDEDEGKQIETIAADIKRARQEGGDYVIIYLHWGAEYHDMPLKSQRKLALALCLEGADMILGSGPHVIQPLERVYSMNGRILATSRAGAREHLIAYSLGNCISHQRGMPKFGMALRITLAKGPGGIYVQNATPIILESVEEGEEYHYRGEVSSMDTFHLREVPLQRFIDYLR
jgi:poly-gamma-glutamate capsule biosynthesis protein CapA/YwtB (metallophosphatase superfamily)